MLNGSLSFSIKISEIIKREKLVNSALLKKISKFYGLNMDPDNFVSIADPGSGSKLNGS